MTRVSIEIEKVSNGYFIHLNHGSGAVTHAVDDSMVVLLQRITDHFIGEYVVKVQTKPWDADVQWVEGM